MDFKFKKKYGQNFLKHESTIKKIINSIDIEENDLIVEIGPGSGALTKHLADVDNQVICYEIDTDLEQFLSKYESNHLNIIYDDFVNRNIIDDISVFEYEKVKFIGNLPYYITTPIILKIIDSIIPDQMIFMVQKEVAERFSAKPGSRDYGSITVLLNYYFDVKTLFTIKRTEFKPEPNVDSAIVKFVKKENMELVDPEKFNKLLKDAFQFKRKNLKNNLKGYDIEKVSEVLEKHNLSLSNRAEDLSVQVFIDLVKNIYPLK